ncbi:hypothetical protein CCP3SC1AL1_630011 [Gammaproteobacteria bacterium]
MKHTATAIMVITHLLLPVILSYGVLFPARLHLSQKSACRLISLYLIIAIIYHGKTLL